MSAGKGVVSERLSIVLFCKEMKWDYYTYMAQPSWFMEMMKIVISADIEYHNRMVKSANRRNRRQ